MYSCRLHAGLYTLVVCEYPRAFFLFLFLKASGQEYDSLFGYLIVESVVSAFAEVSYPSNFDRYLRALYPQQELYNFL